MSEQLDGSAGRTHDPDQFRSVLGNFCTGVTIVTSMNEDEPVGFACQAFAALSLDPPLVLFCPSSGSRTWPLIQKAGYFCINVLAESQREVSQVFGTAGADKFGATTWKPSVNGAPVLEGVLSWIDCTIETAHEAGDHHVVIGRVTNLGTNAAERPLLFYQGDYTATEVVASGGPSDPGVQNAVVQALLTWPRHEDWL